MNFAKYRVQLSTKKKYSSKYKYKYEYEYSIPGLSSKHDYIMLFLNTHIEEKCFKSSDSALRR